MEIIETAKLTDRRYFRGNPVLVVSNSPRFRIVFFTSTSNEFQTAQIVECSVQEGCGFEKYPFNRSECRVRVIDIHTDLA